MELVPFLSFREKGINLLDQNPRTFLILEGECVQLGNFIVYITMYQLLVSFKIYFNLTDSSIYRKFRQWVHNRIGIRLVIPSCVVKKIRAEYPTPNGVYDGFRERESLRTK